jgi:hypothetical protein
MRIVATLLGGTLGYAVALLLINEAVGASGNSRWYLLPFVVSLGTVIAVAVPWSSWRSVNRIATVVATCLLAVLVLAVDIAGTVWYSCAKGSCL